MADEERDDNGMSEETENVLDQASESLEQARQLPSIDPTLGRMMDSFDNAVNTLRESQCEQLDAQKELGRKQIEMAERKATVMEKLSDAGMKFAFCFLVIGAVIVAFLCSPATLNKF
jgi:cellobiose-specific phosphotransferase system component IIA